MKTSKEKQIDAKRLSMPSKGHRRHCPRRHDGTLPVIWHQLRMAADTLGEGEVAQVNGDHQQVVYWLQVRAANVGASPRGHLQTLDLDNLVHILRSRERTGDVHVVIVAANQEVAAEVEILFLGVAGILARETGPQSAP